MLLLTIAITYLRQSTKHSIVSATINTISISLRNGIITDPTKLPIGIPLFG